MRPRGSASSSAVRSTCSPKTWTIRALSRSTKIRCSKRRKMRKARTMVSDERSGSPHRKLISRQARTNSASRRATDLARSRHRGKLSIASDPRAQDLSVEVAMRAHARPCFGCHLLAEPIKLVREMVPQPFEPMSSRPAKSARRPRSRARIANLGVAKHH